MKTATIVLSALMAATALAQPHGHNKLHNRRHAHNVRHVKKDVQEEKRALKTEWVIETKWVTKTEYYDTTTTVIANSPPATQTRDGQFYEAPSPAPQPKATAPAAPAPPPAAAAPPSPPVVFEPPVERIVDTGGYTGDLTYYTLGLGACGNNDAGKDRTENIVALSHLLMGPLSNTNSYCGRSVRITANGKSVTAKVWDKCMGCEYNNIDGSEAIFLALFGSLDRGRTPVSWTFI